MPVSITKTGKNKYNVRTPGGIKARGTTKAKAESQARLLRGIEHGWRPTGRKRGAMMRMMEKKRR